MSKIMAILLALFIGFSTAQNVHNEKQQLLIEKEQQEIILQQKEVERRIRQEQLKLKFEEAEREKKKINTENILFIGNSLAEGISYVDDNFDYITKVGISLSGLRTGGYWDRINNHKFDTVIIIMGTNELGSYSEELFMEEYQLLINKIKTVNKSAKIILSSIPPVAEKTSYAAQLNNKNVQKYNKYILNLAKKNNLLYLNNLGYFGNVLSSDITEDGIHLTGTGYIEWLNYIKEFIADYNNSL